MSWRNARFYLGPGDPFDRGEDERSPPRCKETKTVERIIVRDNVPDDVIDQLEERMIEIAVDVVLESKNRRKKT